MAGMNWEKANREEKAQARAPHRVTEVVAWWWTPAYGGSTCSDCGERVAKGSALAFNFGTQQTLCEVCVDAQGLQPRPSKKWLRAQRG